MSTGPQGGGPNESGPTESSPTESSHTGGGQRETSPERAPRADTVEIVVDGERYRVPAGTTVAAALWNVGRRRFRRSVDGEPRAPICFMGICFECRVTLDGVAHRRACTEICRDGMEVATDA